MTGDASTLGRRLFSGTRGHIAVTLVLLLASSGAQIGIARRSGLDGLGEYVATSLSIFVASVLATSGIPLAVAQRTATYHERGDDARATAVVETGFVLVLALSLGVGALIASLGAALLAHVSSVGGPAIALAVVAAGLVGFVPVVFQARLQLAMSGLVSIAHPFAVVLALALDTFRPGVAPATMALAGYFAAGTVSLAALLASGCRPRYFRREALPLVGQALRSLPLVYTAHLGAWTDRILISILLGANALGIYQGALALVEGVTRIPRASGSFIVAALARAAVDRGAAIDAMVYSHLRLSAAGGAVAAATIIAGADGIGTLIYGSGSVEVVTPLRVMAASLVPSMASVVLVTVFTALRTPLALALGLLLIGTQLVALRLLAPASGVVGAAAAYSITAALSSLAYLFVARKQGLRQATRGARGALVVGVVAVAVGATFAVAPLPWPARAIGAAVTTATIAGAWALDRRDIEVARRVLGGR